MSITSMLQIIISESPNSVLKIYTIFRCCLIEFSNIVLVCVQKKICEIWNVLELMEIISCLYILTSLDCTKHNGISVHLLWTHYLFFNQNSINSIHELFSGLHTAIRIHYVLWIKLPKSDHHFQLCYAFFFN